MKINYWQTLHENGFYHIYNRASGRIWLFPQNDNYKYFLKKWDAYLVNYLDTYAYCLMSNHFHFIVKVKPVNEEIKQAAIKENTQAAQRFLKNEISYNTFLEDQFKRFFSAYALAYNKAYDRHGTLFQKRFKRVRLLSFNKICNKICYVHHNPIHHNVSPFYDAWTYSSYKAYLSIEQTKVARADGLALFDESNQSVAHFIQYHEWYKDLNRNLRQSIDFDDDLGEYEQNEPVFKHT